MFGMMFSMGGAMGILFSAHPSDGTGEDKDGVAGFATMTSAGVVMLIAATVLRICKHQSSEETPLLINKATSDQTVINMTHVQQAQAPTPTM